MSDTVTRSLWKPLDLRMIEDAGPDVDVLAISIQGNGTIYAVTVAGPKGLGLKESIDALRSACAFLIREGGGDMSVVGCSNQTEDPTFDTGSQRPS